MKKLPKPRGWMPIFKIGLVIEIGIFGVSYLTWSHLNASREYRWSMNKSWPTILEWYYNVGEYMSKHNTIRRADYEAWRIEKNWKPPA